MTSRLPVCVVGCSGFVGSHVTAHLLSLGYTVHGTMRDTSEEKTRWLHERVGTQARDGAKLILHAAEMRDPDALQAAMDGCDGVFLSAGTEKQRPETIEIMLGGVRCVLQTAQKIGIKPVVITSSTGSTNPPGPEPVPKNELEHWSDPVQQISVGKYSPAAKTLMEHLALRMMEESEGALRVAIFNPSLIAGPAFQPAPVPSLQFILGILKGERMTDTIPNGSMSIIDVRDLAALQVSAFETKDAKGRYFAVKKSWSWRDILAGLSRAYPAYKIPDIPPPAEPVMPTQFDLSRQQTLGVTLRDLDEILQGVVQELRTRQLLPS